MVFGKINFDHIANSSSCQVREKDRNQRRNVVLTDAYGESVHKSRALAGKNNGTGVILTTQQRLDVKKQKQSNARSVFISRKRVVSGQSVLLQPSVDPIIERRQQLADKFANETGRDIEWAKKRLNLHKWNYNEALAGTASRSAMFLKQKKLSGQEPISINSYEDVDVKDALINKLVIEASEKTATSINSFSAKRLLESNKWQYDLALAAAINQHKKTSIDDLIHSISFNSCSLSPTSPDLETAFSRLSLDDDKEKKRRVKLLAQRLSEVTGVHIFIAQQIVASVSDWGQCLTMAFKCMDQERRVSVLVEATGLPAQWASQLLIAHGWDINKAISHAALSMY